MSKKDHTARPSRGEVAGARHPKVAQFKGGDSGIGRAASLVFLASNAGSSYITGTVLQVMGGETTGG